MSVQINLIRYKTNLTTFKSLSGAGGFVIIVGSIIVFFISNPHSSGLIFVPHAD